MSNSKLCFIGAGFHATTNIIPSAVEAGAVIQAIATRSMERSKAALQRFGSRGTAYDDYKIMLQQEHCDGVVIVAQPHDQFSLALDCVRACKNVYVDKPLGWNAKEAAQIADAADQAGVVLMVGFMKRFAPCYMKVKEWISEGTLGEVRSFQLTFAVDSTPFCTNEEEFMKLVAIHMVDLMRYLFGEVSQVAGFSNNDNRRIANSLTLQFENGVVGSVYFAGMSAWSKESESLLVTFDHGYMRANDIETVTIHQSLPTDAASWKSLTEQVTVFSPSISTMSGGVKDLYLRGFVGEMAHFMKCCTEGVTPQSSGRDNVATMLLCDRILHVGCLFRIQK
ncbi:Gfo/Idh/MocA family protein [Brevibacillus brevis]|uniref:Gfo/Idh/MocA family protein n=1 Tax=Brevibacillus brevis TaxID=1393 RepID=UPI000D10A80B|nr:Gfo/Idh/MocA family oxidoreductase [Brevibacillus brevis]PSJ66752.1 gfo/Idh/MocA family oxidoreductase [Brevibacillus brevis]RED35883.1 putative dehydrogenase [Brevibacillus brevis]GEC88368.1 oxidoreductase [Brevibacillus brevis]VEF89007.1 Virulence factor mviM homolog [Brevibacillus brevis]